jgi:hypothetical protein
VKPVFLSRNTCAAFVFSHFALGLTPSRFIAKKLTLHSHFGQKRPVNGTKRKANANTAIRVKDVDGTVTVDEEREKKRKLAKIPTVESSLMTYIQAQLVDKDDDMDCIRKKMELWINANNYTT